MLKKIILLWLLITPFAVFSENGFALTGYEECKAKWLDFQPNKSKICLPLPDTTCKYFFPHYSGEPVISIGWTFSGDEECIDPNPDETPSDPLADQLNEVSSPNECRGG